jgi:hypothetical protein
MAADETENNREKSTVLLGDLHYIRMKLVQSVFQRSRIEKTRGQSEIQKKYSERFVIQKEFNV